MTKKVVKFESNPLLSGPTLETRSRFGSPFRYIPIADIDVDPDQPRRVFDNETLAELATSISEFGLLCPILVRTASGGTFRLISGERRLRACKVLGMETIPAIVDADEDEGAQTLSKQLVENLQREDLSPLDRAAAIGQLRDRFSLSVRDIASKLGLSKSLVQRSLEILALPDDLQAALLAGAQETKILALVRLADRGQRRKILEQLDELSRTQIEQMIDELLGLGRERDMSHGGTAEKGKGSRARQSTEDRRIVDELQRTLGTKVHILRGKKGKGRLVLEFYSADDLKEVYSRLVS